MIIRKLTHIECEKIKSIKKDTFEETVNAKKDFINQLVIDWVFENGTPKNVWFNFFTQYGKSYINHLLFEKFYTLNSNTDILAIYPELRLKKESIAFNRKNLTCKVINTAAKSMKPFDVVLIDELQYATNESTINHNVLKIPNNYIYGNAAFLVPDQIKVIEKAGITHCFQIDEYKGLELGLVPMFKTINIEIPLTREETMKYYTIQKSFKEAVDFIYPYYGNKSAGAIFGLIKKEAKKQREVVANFLSTDLFKITEGQLMGKLLKYISIVKDRKELLKSCKNKFLAVKKIVEINKDKKGIIFVNSQETADKLKNLIGNTSIVYSSITPESNLEKFVNGEYKQVIVIGKANVGKIDNKLEYAIHMAFEANPVKGKQKKGRVFGIDKNNESKVSTNYYLYVPDFKIGEETVESQEFKWLKTIQKGAMFVDYLTLEEVLNEGS